MAEPFLGEIRLYPYGFTPAGWAACNGQTLPINSNQALFSILGIMYGGDGVTNFALPDLRGRVPVHVGNGITQGQKSGEEAHALTVAEMPAHTHTAMAGTGGQVLGTPQGNTWGTNPNGNIYDAHGNGTMGQTAIADAGAGQGHSNMQPYLALNYCIATIGLYPTKD